EVGLPEGHSQGARTRSRAPTAKSTRLLADSPRRTRQIHRTSSGADVPDRRPSLDARLLARSWERNVRIRALGSQPPPSGSWVARGSGQAIRGIRLAILRQPGYQHISFSPCHNPLTSLYRQGYAYVMVESNHIIGETLFALTSFAVRQRGREVSLTAASTLATLARTGPRRLTDLAVNEGVTQPSMTAVVSQLEDLGFVERRRAPGDGRVVLVAST